MSISLITVPVKTALSAYDIHIGEGLVAQACKLIRDAVNPSKICIITDGNVGPLYLKELQEGLRASGLKVVPSCILPAGEATKNFPTLEKIMDHALAQGMDRRSVFIALGGGVIGDITGFAAAIFMRGIAFVQMPTTLMAQVDSAVGGKTAVNTQGGKNIAGAFHQPALVLSDTNVLATLSEREMKAGYAEILKTALIEGDGFFDWLEARGASVIARDPSAVSEALLRACAFKSKIVAADEREETGQRALLNLGHTFGHAFEALGGYDSRLLHGEAVAAGLRLMTLFSMEQAGLDGQQGQRILAHMERLNLVQKPVFAVKVAEMIDKMRHDKKAERDRITLILLRGIGAAVVDKNVDSNALADFLARHL